MTNPYVFIKTPDEQDAFWAGLRASEVKRQQYQLAANAAVAQAVGDFHQRAPYADPGVALAAGHGIANGTVNGEQLAQAVDKSVQQGNRPAWSPTESQGLMDSIRQSALMRKPQAEIDAQKMAMIQKQAQAKSDPLIRDAQGNIDQAATLKAAGVPQQEDKGFDWSNPTEAFTNPLGIRQGIESAVKGVTRTALSAAMSSWEEVQNRGAQAFHNAGDIASDLRAGDLSGAAGAYVRSISMANPLGAAQVAATGGESAKEGLYSATATNTYQAIRQAHETGSVDLGSGFFPGGTVTRVWQPEAARDVRGVIPGTNTAWTFGRQIASTFEQPGTRPYNVMSGFIDGAAQFALDPSLALQDALQVPRAAKLLDVAAKATEQALEAEKAVVGAPEAAAAAAKTQDVVGAVRSTLGTAEGKSVILDLKNAQSPEAVAAIIGIDVGKPTLQRIASLDNWGDIRGALQSAARSNPEWGAQFAALGGDAAAHIANVPNPEEAVNAVRSASDGVLIDAERPTVNASKTDAFLHHGSTQPFVQHLANSSDALDIAQRLGPKASPSLISAVAKAGDEDAVRQALKNDLGLSIATPGDMPGTSFGYDLKRQVINSIGDSAFGRQSTRLLARVPDRVFEGFLPDANYLQQRQSLNAMDNWSKLVKLPYEERSRLFGIASDGFASGSPEGRFQALTAWADGMRQGLTNLGMPEAAAKQTMTMFKDRGSALFGVNALAQPYDWNYIATHTGNADLSMVSPSLLSQELGSLVTMPDPREIRRLTSSWGRIISNVQYDEANGIMRAKNWKPPLSWAQSLGEDIFPKLAISRAATALRVTMDEQLRLAASGLPNMISHPIQWIGLIAGSNSDLTRLGLGHEDIQAMIDQVAGSVFKADSADQSLRYTRATGMWTDVGKESPQRYLDGATDMARQFARDPIAARVAQGQTTDEIMDFLHSKEGESAFNRYAELGDNAKSRDARTGKTIATPVDLRDDAVLRGWIDRNIRGQIDAFAGENADLRKAIGSNQIGDLAPSDAVRNPETGAMVGAAFDNGQPTSEMRDLLRDHMAGDQSPMRVKYNVKLNELADADTKMDQWNKATGWFMGKLFNVPIRTLTRSPVFRDAFFQRVAELAEHLHPDEANRLLKTIESTAGEQGFSGRIGEFLGGDQRLQQIVDNAGKAHGDLALDDVFDYAKGHAIDTVHDVLFDNAQRSNLEQSLRIVAPFAMAWREILTKWTQVLAHNPGFLRRVDMAVQGARGSGFFYTDPTTGKEVFNYPASDWVVNALTGGGGIPGAIAKGVATGGLNVLANAPVIGKPISSALPIIGDIVNSQGGMPGADPLRGDVQGLNLVSGSFIPGLGPTIQLPLAHLLKNKPWADSIRGLLMPYGVPTDENAPLFGQLGSYFEPGWMQKVQSAITTSPDSTSSFGNTYSQVLQELASSGKYGTGMPDRQRMIEDAQSKARVLTILRGLGQFVAPASPSYSPEIATADGDHLMSELAKDAHDLQAKDYNTWVQKFIALYGEGPFIAAQSKTRSVNGGLDASKAFGEWEAGHQGAMGSYPDVASYFAEIGSDFDSEVYNRQLATGERKKLTANDMLNASQATVAKWKYDQAKQQLGDRPTSAQQDWLAHVKQLLQDQYPGYAVQPSVQIADLPAKVQQLKRAADDPSLKGPVQTATATYLYLRDQALKEAQNRGSRGAGSLAGTNNADLRAWLAGQATSLVKKYPTFSRLFDSVLSAEVDQ